MYIYNYIRTLNIETGRYSIDYGETETPLIQEINELFSSIESSGIICNGTQISIYFEEELTAEQENQLDTLINNHT